MSEISATRVVANFIPSVSFVVPVTVVGKKDGELMWKRTFRVLTRFSVRVCLRVLLSGKC